MSTSEDAEDLLQKTPEVESTAGERKFSREAPAPCPSEAGGDGNPGVEHERPALGDAGRVFLGGKFVALSAENWNFLKSLEDGERYRPCVLEQKPFSNRGFWENWNCRRWLAGWESCRASYGNADF